jgi:prepilin-type N-terminal cleavage/methylation domain-containing protein
MKKVVDFIKKLLGKSSSSSDSSSGFTLIELLIVIAVLGVLAAAVLVALNPAEQLRRGRDSSRLQQVAQLGHAMQAYYTSQGVAPTVGAADWQTILVNSGDLQNAMTVSATGVTQACGGGASSQGNVCYQPLGAAGTNFAVYTGVESNLYKTKANGGVVCGTGQSAYFIYIGSQGKAGVACLANGTAPGAGVNLRN